MPEHGEEPVAEILPEQPGVISILLAGSINWRKGACMLAPVAQQLASVSTASFRFVWVGDLGEPESFIRLEHEFDHLGLSGSLHIAGRHDGIARFYAAADLFLLPAMEDPFPLVMLEAGMARLPIVAFEGSGGAAEFIHDNGGGITVQYLDVRAIERLMADAAPDGGRRAARGHGREGQCERAEILGGCLGPGPAADDPADTRRRRRSARDACDASPCSIERYASKPE